jgi:hypothetical protein
MESLKNSCICVSPKALSSRAKKTLYANSIKESMVSNSLEEYGIRLSGPNWRNWASSLDRQMRLSIFEDTTMATSR